jgi:hypothetical protein
MIRTFSHNSAPILASEKPGVFIFRSRKYLWVIISYIQPVTNDYTDIEQYKFALFILMTQIFGTYGVEKIKMMKM